MNLPVKHKDKLVTKNQTVSDIMAAIWRMCQLSQKSDPILRKAFKKNNDFKTAESVFNYLKNNIEYRKEPVEKQTAKTVGRIVSDSFGDCKAFATFSYCALNSCGIPTYFRLASYRGNAQPSHIYCIAIIDDKELPFDATLRRLGDEALFTKIYDVKPITIK